MLVGAGISSWTQRSTHKDRLAADRELAERKITADIALAERKLTADITLAERKFQYDRDLDAWKRRTTLAEEVLAEFYQAKDIIDAARAPGSLGVRAIHAREKPGRARKTVGFWIRITGLSSA